MQNKRVIAIAGVVAMSFMLFACGKTENDVAKGEDVAISETVGSVLEDDDVAEKEEGNEEEIEEVVAKPAKIQFASGGQFEEKPWIYMLLSDDEGNYVSNINHLSDNDDHDGESTMFECVTLTPFGWGYEKEVNQVTRTLINVYDLGDNKVLTAIDAMCGAVGPNNPDVNTFFNIYEYSTDNGFVKLLDAKIVDKYNDFKGDYYDFTERICRLDGQEVDESAIKEALAGYGVKLKSENSMIYELHSTPQEYDVLMADTDAELIFSMMERDAEAPENIWNLCAPSGTDNGGKNVDVVTDVDPLRDGSSEHPYEFGDTIVVDNIYSTNTTYDGKYKLTIVFDELYPDYKASRDKHIAYVGYKFKLEGDNPGEEVPMQGKIGIGVNSDHGSLSFVEEYGDEEGSGVYDFIDGAERRVYLTANPKWKSYDMRYVFMYVRHGEDEEKFIINMPK